ncbi:MAG: hypothetical protein JJU06_06720 [Ectothiorhodospiraceae bacterium]|nr:hypothetical protein [Ectothiorhodospiraceae bacterium]
MSNNTPQSPTALNAPTPEGHQYAEHLRGMTAQETRPEIETFASLYSDVDQVVLCVDLVWMDLIQHPDEHAQRLGGCLHGALAVLRDISARLEAAERDGGRLTRD